MFVVYCDRGQVTAICISWQHINFSCDFCTSLYYLCQILKSFIVIFLFFAFLSTAPLQSFHILYVAKTVCDNLEYSCSMKEVNLPYDTYNVSTNIILCALYCTSTFRTLHKTSQNHTKSLFNTCLK